MYLGYDTGGKRYIHLSLNWFQHRTNSNYYGAVIFLSYKNNLDFIGIGNLYDTYYSYYGTGVSYNSYNEQDYFPTTSNRDVIDSAQYFDVWFTWDIFVDSITGVTEVRINGTSLGTSNTGVILNNKFVLQIHPVQWFTGSYVRIDDLLIESSDTPY